MAIVSTAIGIPAAWIFAFLIVFGSHAIIFDRATVPPKSLMTPAQVLIAMLCAGPMATVDLGKLVGYSLPAALSLAVTFAVCLFGAWLLHRFNRVDAATGLLSTLAGGASGVVLVARDVKANVQFVTLTQYLRLSLVVFTLPPLVAWLSSFSDANSSQPSSERGSSTELLGIGEQSFVGAMSQAANDIWHTPWQGVVGAIVVGMIVWGLVRLTAPFFSIPSPYLLLSMAVVVLAIGIRVPEEFLLPEGLTVDVAYAIIGVQAGGTLTKAALRQFSSALPVIFVVIALMIASSLATGWIISALSDFSILDAYLATVPGGIYAVLAFAHDAGSDPLVTVVQVLRVIAMLVAGGYAPAVIKLLQGRNQHKPLAS